MIQLAIVTVLMFVLFFGIGFILNMLLKTTWLPVYLYVLLVIGVIVWFWSKEGGAGFLTRFDVLVESIGGFAFPDYAAAIGGLIGALLSGTAIRSLRAKGYKMF